MAIRRRRHVDRVNSFILVWNGDEIEQISFDGEVVNLPPMDVCSVPGMGSPYRLPSARDRADEPIPGTVLVTDRYAMLEGNRVRVFDAEEFVRWVETIRSELLDRGLVIVDMPEEVEEARAEGRPLYMKSQDAKARLVLENELSRRRKWEDKGVPPPPSSSEHLLVWAIKHLNERGTQLSAVASEDIIAALSAGPQTAHLSAPVVPRPAIQRQKPKVEVRLDPMRLHEQARKLGIKLKMADLNGLLEGDEKVAEDVAERIRQKEAVLDDAGKGDAPAN